MIRVRPEVVSGESPLEPAQRLLAGREAGLALDERLERLDVLVVRHLQVDGARVVGDVKVQHPEGESEERRVKFAMSISHVTRDYGRGRKYCMVGV